MRRAWAFARAIRMLFGSATAHRFMLHVAGRPFFYRQWFDYLDSDFCREMSAESRIELALRPVRPYLRREFDPATKVLIARRHYGIFDRCLNAAALANLRHEDGICLARISGRSGTVYAFSIRAYPSAEGEVRFQFMDESLGEPLTWIWGSFGPAGRSGRALWIGGLQGPRPPHGLAEIARATKDLNGLRPKHALLHAAAATCKAVGAHEIIAPGNRSHISFTFARRYLGRPVKIQSDLDGFWSEFAGSTEPASDYRIALPMHRRSPEQVRAKRRKSWIARYAIVDEIEASTQASMRMALVAPPLVQKEYAAASLPAWRDAMPVELAIAVPPAI